MLQICLFMSDEAVTQRYWPFHHSDNTSLKSLQGKTPQLVDNRWLPQAKHCWQSCSLWQEGECLSFVSPSHQWGLAPKSQNFVSTASPHVPLWPSCQSSSTSYFVLPLNFLIKICIIFPFFWIDNMFIWLNTKTYNMKYMYLRSLSNFVSWLPCLYISATLWTFRVLKRVFYQCVACISFLEVY